MKEIRIKLRDLQIPAISSALEKFISKCPLRFSSPEIRNGILTIDPHDFLELTHYLEKRPENELEIARIKKLASDFVNGRLTTKLVLK